MKHLPIKAVWAIAVILCFPHSLPSQNIQAKVVKVASEPTHVTLYSDRALVKRSASVSLEKGVNSFRFFDLPVHLDPGSVQVSLLSEKEEELTVAQIFSQKTWRDYLKEPAGNTDELQKKLEALTKEKRALEHTRGNLLKKKKLLLSIQIKSANDLNKEISRNEIDIQKWSELLNFYYTNLEVIDKEDLTLTDQISDLKKEIKKLRNQMANTKKRGKGVYLTQVSVESTRATTARLEIQYMTRNASWQPEYDIRTTEGKEVELYYRAGVKQNSGEDWNNIKLTLSTARPAMGLSPPELKPLWLRTYNLKSYYRSKQKSRAPSTTLQEEPSMDVSRNGAGGEGAESLSEPPPKPTAVEQELASTTFVARRKANVPSTNALIHVPLVKKSLKSKLRYKSVPLLSEGVYISGKITNTLDYPLLPGMAHLYYGRRYTGSTQLKGVMPGESFELPLGVDDSIKVERKKIREYHDETGFIGSKKRVAFGLVIQVQNLKKIPIVLEISERLPVSSNEKITVTTRKITPKDYKEDKKRPGILTWKLQLKPGEKKEISIEYYIEHPKEIMIEQY